MKAEDILYAIGNVEDTCIIRAKEKQNLHKRFWVTIGSVAACMALIISIPFIYMATTWRSGSDRMPGAENSSENNMSGNHSAQKAAVSKVEIYLTNDKIVTVTEVITHDSPEKIEPVVEFVEAVTDTREGTAYPVTDSNDDLDIKDIYIFFRDNGGNLIAEYRLNQNILFDYQTYVKYELTDSELTELYRLLGIEEE